MFCLLVEVQAPAFCALKRTDSRTLSAPVECVQFLLCQSFFQSLVNLVLHGRASNLECEVIVEFLTSRTPHPILRWRNYIEQLVNESILKGLCSSSTIEVASLVEHVPLVIVIIQLVVSNSLFVKAFRPACTRDNTRCARCTSCPT